MSAPRPLEAEYLSPAEEALTRAVGERADQLTLSFVSKCWRPHQRALAVLI